MWCRHDEYLWLISLQKNIDIPISLNCAPCLFANVIMTAHWPYMLNITLIAGTFPMFMIGVIPDSQLYDLAVKAVNHHESFFHPMRSCCPEPGVTCGVGRAKEVLEEHIDNFHKCFCSSTSASLIELIMCSTA